MKKLLLLIATSLLITNAQEIHAEGVYAGATGGLNSDSRLPSWPW